MKKYVFGLTLITLLFASTLCVACGEDVHIHDYGAEWTSDEDSHWHNCIGCEEFVDKGEHVGGQATCIQKAVCDVCDAEYGETAEHSYVIDNHDTEYHWKECACGQIDETTKEAHYGGRATCEEKAVCEGCKIEYGDYTEHTYEKIEKNEVHHWKECACGAVKEDSKEQHYGGEATCKEKAVCEVCTTAYGGFAEHQYNRLDKSETEHYYTCDCGEIDESSRVQHFGGVATETQRAKCQACGEEYGNLAPHEHKFTQEKLGEKYLEKEATCEESASYYKSCACGEAGGETFHYGAPLGHDFDGKWITDDNAHWKSCQNAECKETGNRSEHSGGTATCQKPASCQTCGVEYGETLKHEYTEDGQDETHTWKECACGAIDETSVKEKEKESVEDKEDTNEGEGDAEYIYPDGSGDLYDPYILNENGTVQVFVDSVEDYIYFCFEAIDDGVVSMTNLVNVDDTDSYFINAYIGENLLAEKTEFNVWIGETYYIKICVHTAGDSLFTFTFV